MTNQQKSGSSVIHIKKNRGDTRKPSRVFGNKVPTLAAREKSASQDMDRVAQNAFRTISMKHAGMVGAGQYADPKFYEAQRAKFLKKHPTMLALLNEREVAHRLTVVVGYKPRRQAVNRTAQAASNHRAVAGNVRKKIQSKLEATRASESRPRTLKPEPTKSFWVQNTGE